jgi:hypothetical protein
MQSRDAAKKYQVSAYFSGDVLDWLDDFIAYQKDVNNYPLDRAHVLNVLLRRFVNHNDCVAFDKYRQRRRQSAETQTIAAS